MRTPLCSVLFVRSVNAVRCLPIGAADAVTPRGASSMAEQRTFNPLVQGSTPWRPTQFDLARDRVIERAAGKRQRREPRVRSRAGCPSGGP